MLPLEDGDERDTIHFAWVPVWRGGWRWIWWRDYVLTERFHVDYGGVSTGIWVHVRAVPLDEIVR